MSPLKALPVASLTPLATKPDYALCLERIEAWWNQAVVDRPPVRFYKHNAQFEGGEPLDRKRWPSLEARWFDVDYQVTSFEQAIAGKEWIAETFPFFWPNLGPSVYSAFYGGSLIYSEVTSWYEPVITDLDDLSPIGGDPFQSVYFRKLEELTRAALARCGDRYWVGYSDFHPNLDCVAAWCGMDNLFLAMAEEPEKLAKVSALSVRDFQRIFGHFDAMLKAAGQPSGTWMNLPCPGRFHIPSCDVSCMIATPHFARFSLANLSVEMAGMDRAIYHVDGKGVANHLDLILERPDIQAIQWVQGLGADWPIMQWVPLLRRILAAGKSVMVDVPIEELDEFMDCMPCEGVFLCLGVAPDAEKSVLKRIERW